VHPSPHCQYCACRTRLAAPAPCPARALVSVEVPALAPDSRTLVCCHAPLEQAKGVPVAVP
jgi:hypothetical protein